MGDMCVCVCGGEGVKGWLGRREDASSVQVCTFDSTVWIARIFIIFSGICTHTHTHHIISPATRLHPITSKFVHPRCYLSMGVVAAPRPPLPLSKSKTSHTHSRPSNVPLSVWSGLVWSIPRYQPVFVYSLCDCALYIHEHGILLCELLNQSASY
jgi:hypothetical protein